MEAEGTKRSPIDYPGDKANPKTQAAIAYQRDRSRPLSTRVEFG